MIRSLSSIAWATIAWLALTGAARPDDPFALPAIKLPQAVPSPSLEQLAQITKTGRRSVPSVFMVGRPNDRTATAFLISRRHRLLATAGHVADYFHSGEGRMLAIPDGTATAYQIDRVYYHPGTLRQLDVGLYVRTDNPEDGEVDHVHGLDIAVLRLAEGGPDLPEELSLATSEEFPSFKDRAMGLLGFPSRAADGWPTTRRPAWATLGSGVFSSTHIDAPTDLVFPPHQRIWVQGDLKEGSSGGPAFLDNGHVAGVISSSLPNSDDTQSTMCARIDTLHELLRYHSLAEPSPDPLEVLNPRKEWKNDPRLPQLRVAVGKIREANNLREAGDYRGAGLLCNEVIEGFPQYAYAVLERSWVYSDYCNEHWESLIPELRDRLAQWAFDDSLRCLNTVNYEALPFLVHSQNKLLLGRVHSDLRHFGEVVSRVDELIEWFSFDESKKAWAIQLRAQARHQIGDLKFAEADFAESIRLNPEEPRWLLGRAKFFKAMGKSILAAEDRRRAEELRKKAEELRKQAKVPLPDQSRSSIDLESAPQVRSRAKPIFAGDPR